MGEMPGPGGAVVPVRWWRNPALVQPPGWARVERLWRLSTGGMGRGWLPEAGGANDQPAWLITAFGILSAEGARLDEAERARRGV
ncbi:hypothetical protein [Falsiroseomonas selenitidurans]|uniref:Uncharacterized protein n=1 Tax=Falsiroseomonas selenitidurans TaxID=2716335 RepID=A0ABX1E8F8_9PROT|nr:hypothetical protein [Falsiroseomonas selenitidurans]NKC33499.1 hypothetical protein [Falsiroseomonas selenitidurans]